LIEIGDKMSDLKNTGLGLENVGITPESETVTEKTSDLIFGHKLWG